MIGSRTISVEEAERTHAAKRKREQQSETIAKRLRAAGIEVERKDVSPVVCVGALSGEAKPVTNRFVNNNMIPAMQAVNGAPQRASLGAYLAQHRRGQNAKFFVLTNGERCNAKQLKGRFSELSRDLSRFISRARTEWPDVEFVARKNEVTINKDRLCHPHANVCVITQRYMPDEEWLAFNAALRQAIGGWVYGARQIQSVDEFVKYSVKFGIEIDEEGDELASESRRDEVLEATQQDLFDFADGQQDVLVELYKQLYRGKSFAAFGDYARWRKSLEEQRVVPKRLGDDYVLVKMCPYRPKTKRGEGEGQGDTTKAENVLLNWSMPFAHGENGTLVEPTLRVIGYTTDPQTPEGEERLLLIEALTEKLQDACQGAAARKAAVATGAVADLDAARAARKTYSPHMHDNCPTASGPGSNRSLPKFESIEGTNNVIHRESVTVMTVAEAEKHGYQPPQRPREPIVAPDPAHAARLASLSVGNRAEAASASIDCRGDWRQYELPV